MRSQPIALLLTLFSLLLLASLVGGYIFQWRWVGVVVQSPSSNSQPIKTLWDWMSLLIIPVILALFGFFFTRTERKNEQIITADNQQETAFQAYLDRMSELLLHEELRASKPDDEVRNVARVRTLTMLCQLNTRRANYLLAFLHEAGLIATTTNKSIVTFSQADLSKVDLHLIDLHMVNLTEANLIGAVRREVA